MEFIVTAEHPENEEIEGLDFERCAALHNHIIILGLQGLGTADEEIDKRSWWEFYGQEAEDIEEKLDSSIVEFLKRAWIGTEDPNICFFYYLGGLAHPSRILNEDGNEAWDWDDGGDDDGTDDDEQKTQTQEMDEEEDTDDDDKPRYLLLYTATNLASHPSGLIFDQTSFRAIMEVSIHDGDAIYDGRQDWTLLEYILTAYIEMITLGKIVAIRDDSDYEGPPDRQTPWIIKPCSKEILNLTLDAYRGVCSAIEAKLPASTDTSAAQNLADELLLDGMPIPSDCFARDFLCQAQRPRFKYIAPGLRVPSREELLHQASGTVTGEDGDIYYPSILIFPGDRQVRGGPGEASGLPSQNPSGDAPGLYLTDIASNHSNAFSDASQLVLPFGIGSSGFARLSDDSYLGGAESASYDRDPGDSYDELYQMGHNKYIEGHPVALFRILLSWKARVEGGDWEVDGSGVMGGMGKWREADTEENWEKYWIDPWW